jgi:hypothetical protein
VAIWHVRMAPVEEEIQGFTDSESIQSQQSEADYSMHEENEKYDLVVPMEEVAKRLMEGAGEQSSEYRKMSIPGTQVHARYDGNAT